MSAPRVGYGPISSYSRVQLLALLQRRGGRSIAELAEATRLHPNTVREHLQRLMDGGYVIEQKEKRATRGRPRMLYSAATGREGASSDIARDKVRDAVRRGAMIRRLVPEIEGGSLPSAAQAQLDALVDHLEESGFEPVLDDEALTLDLSPCPHATAHACDLTVLCAVHLELMRGVLAQTGGPLEARCVRSRELPEDCTVELSIIHGS